MLRSEYPEIGFWHATYGPYRPSPPAEGRVRADVAIVGGGFTGMATAHYLLTAEPSLNVVVLEGETVGYGASGRNGSFAMTVVGLGLDVLVKLKGRQRALEMHRYMERAVDTVGELVAENGIECDYIRPGFLRMATTPVYVQRIQREVELANSLGIEGIEWLDREQARERVASDQYLGAWWEPRMALVNPLKLVRGLKRSNEHIGAVVCEHSPVLSIHRGATIRLRTPNATVEADKLVLATNAYSHLLSPLRRMQVPAWTYVVVTDPLGADQLAAVAWQGRQGVEDARNLIHYYRLTPDDRLLMGGGPVGLSFGSDMDRDQNPSAWAHLEEHIGEIFPAFRGIGISHRWGGPFSVTTDLMPALGYLGDERCAYSLGCIGHGVAASHLNGQTLRDLVLERDSELTEAPLVNRRVLPWPPEPLRLAVSATLRGYLAAEDWWHERGTQA